MRPEVSLVVSVATVADRFATVDVIIIFKAAPSKLKCTTGKERRITRWKHEHVIDAAQRRLHEHLEKKCASAAKRYEHPFGTIKARMGAAHFLTKTLPRRLRDGPARVGYNLTRVMNIMGIQPLMAAIWA
jgi:hypothetical protein